MRSRPAAMTIDPQQASTRGEAGSDAGSGPTDRRSTDLQQCIRLPPDVVETIDIACLARVHEIRPASDGVADDARKAGGEGFVHDEPPGLRKIARQREAVRDGVRESELGL